MKNLKPDLSIVIPFYNDAGCPGPFIKDLKNSLKGINYELILVDDCSKDSTPEEVDALKDKNVIVIHNSLNKDYGGAIMTGLDIAKGKILGFTCGDGEVTGEDIVKVYKEMKGYDTGKSVKPSSFSCPKNSKKQGVFDIFKAIRITRKDGIQRKIISKVFNLWARIRFNLNLEDINGYPVYFKKEVYQSLENIRPDWIFNIDLLRKAFSKGYTLGSVKVFHQPRFKGKSHMTLKRIFKMVTKFISYS